MSYSNTVTQEDLKNVLNEVLPSPMMIKTVQYTSTITWYSTSNPFGDVYTDIEIDGWTPINLSYLVGGSGSSFVFGSQIELKENNGVMCAHGYFRMTGTTPSSTTQNSVIWTVVYIKNAPMTLPIADYIVEQGTSGIWTYRKWNSGVAECWGYSLVSGAFSSWGSIYSKDIASVSFPTGLFNAVPHCYSSTSCTGGNSVASANSNTATASATHGITVIRGTNLSGTPNFATNYYAKGTWK